MTVKSLASIDARIRELKAELQASVVYQELAVLEEMRPKLAAINGVAPERVSVERVLPKKRGKQPKGKVTQTGAAELAVEAIGHPLTVEEIVADLPKFGAVISGRNARSNMTSILSKRSALKSIRWHDKRAWWFKDRPLPTE